MHLRGFDLRLDYGTQMTLQVDGPAPARLPIPMGPETNSVPKFGCYDKIVHVRTGVTFTRACSKGPTAAPT
jgi:hypothetical protein